MMESIKLCQYVQETFHGNLGWTDASIEKIEELLDYFYLQAQNDKPTETQISYFAKGFGSYIGEVYRRNHGAEWGIVTLQGKKFPGLKASGSGVEFWPWGRAQQRIVEGPSHNVWHYYQDVLEKGAAQKKSPGDLSFTSWWKRLFQRP